MIIENTVLKSADNSGAKLLKCIRVFGGTGKRWAGIGDEIKVSVVEAIPNSTAKKSSVYNAIVVRTRKEKRRADGSYIKFDTNAAVLINASGDPVGTRIFGPVPGKELKERGYARIAHLGQEQV